MTARAPRYDHDVFVRRFLEGLSNSLGASNSARLSGVKRSLEGTRNDRNISTSMKVLNARMALGADDQTYLSAGLSLLWAGDPNPEGVQVADPHLLFPSSMGGAGLPQGARQAMEATIRVRLEEQMNQRMASLGARLPALLHILSLPEVGWHVKEELEAVRLWSTNTTSMAALITEMGALEIGAAKSVSYDVSLPKYKAAGRHTQSFRLSDWRARIENVRERPEYLEELMTICSVLSGLYARSSADPVVRSPMELADLYTSAAVDVALERDWSTMEGVMRSYRAYRACTEKVDTPPASVAGGVRGSDAAPDTSEVLIKRQSVQRAEGVPVLDAGRAPQPLPARAAAVGAGVGQASAANQAQVAGQDADAAGARATRGWMNGLLSDTPRPADVGAHSGGPGGVDRHHNEEEYPEHRIERTQEQKPGNVDDNYARNLKRIVDLVLKPVGEMAGMSMSLSASPLWNPAVLQGFETDEEEGREAPNRGTSEAVAPTLERAAGDALNPKLSERVGAWISGQTELPSPPRRRMTTHTVVHALYGKKMGASRVIPSEVTAWLGSTVLNAENANDTNLRNEFNDVRMYKKLRDEIHDKSSRGARVDGVMAPLTQYMEGNRRDNRFVSYVLLRGLTADYGPNEVGTDEESAPLRYTRGINSFEPTGYARPAPMAPLPGDGVSRVSLAPLDLVDRWRERDTGEGKKQVELTHQLEDMIMHAPAVKPSKASEFELTVQLSDKIALENPKQQHVQNTLREARWAPISKAPQSLGSGMSVPSYALGARAASATATYEHLIDTLLPRKHSDHVARTFVPKAFQGALRAALKLKQLPHCIVFDQAYRAAGGRMQRAMAETRDGEVSMWDMGNKTALYRTLLPTIREHAYSVYEVVPPAFTGVWSDGNEDASKTTTQRLNSTNFNLGTGAGSTEQALKELLSRASSENAIKPPTYGLGIAHLPVGLPFEKSSSSSSSSSSPPSKTLGVPAGAAREHQLMDLESPEWLNSDAAVRTLINECARLAARIMELRAQHEALDESRDTGESEELEGVVERERRGAIWEDALREMSISSDRLYNFLRSMSGTLHEDIQAVVEVEDHAMEASNRAVRERRQEILKQSSQFQSRLIERVMQGVLRDSKLQFDLQADPAAQGRRAATELVVVNKETVDRVRDLAQGTSGMPFFAQNVELERTLGTSSEPMRLMDLMERLQAMAARVREGMLDSLNQTSLDGARSSLEYLSRPRNSYLVRLKPEAFAAIKAGYSTFSTEWRARFQMSVRRPSAWECIEGKDMNLTNAFAEFCAHKMAHSRMFGSSHAGYIGVTPARANALQLRMALQKLVARAHEYVQLVPPPVYSAGAQSYNAEMPQDFLVDNVLAGGNQAYTAMVGNSLFQRGRRWGWNMTGSA